MKQQMKMVLELDDLQCKNYMELHGEELFSMMLANLGSPDGELRDELIYRLVVKLISGQHLKTDQLLHATNEIATAQYLFAAIGERDSDSVFIRSFATLWLTVLLWLDKEHPFMSSELRSEVMEKSATYLVQEQDIRGFVDGKGWAHSIAHGADLMSMIASHPAAEKRLIPTILEGVASCFWKGGVYTDDEDERLTAIFISLARKDYPEEVLIEWVEQVFDKLDKNASSQSQSFYQARTNIMQFMKTLYFALKKYKHYPKLQSTASFFIQKWQNA
ncbi:DUF2785 domain-containing protein [Sporosarcina sp. ACRSL]|uniref:DUF2785 domain-containing protein n=1 Tax=Sporosarcina sp. ACRSL TaxID=2918215 RepID=UPI001EF64C1D|nr:DUF2785 domain-containing protein [Sporosarcina sp. ACRSL]MCG7345403.1 DUF2785 domain-containing protein [Sporosarcina sp. ACRSL]